VCQKVTCSACFDAGFGRRHGNCPGGGVVLPVDECKSIELGRRATESKEKVS
jgi:hypothetical protein